MESFLYYLLRASILMALFYSFYKIFFAKTTFHAINRFLLLGLVLTTILLPFLRFGLIPRKEVAPLVFDSLMTDFSTIPVSEAGEAGFAMDIPWVPLLTGLFSLGLLFSFVRYLIGLSQVIAIIWRSEKQLLADNTVLYVTDKSISPFSWMNYIVLSREELSTSNGAIIRHERAHVRSRHSMDMLFFDLFTCLFWFNPFSWLLRREIQTIHEYQADKRVLDKGTNPKQYQLLLIRESVGEQKFALANNFHRRDLHKRITMMTKNKTNNQVKWSYTLVFPALFLAMILLSIPKLNASIPEGEHVADEKGNILTQTKDTVVITSAVDMVAHFMEPDKTKILPQDSMVGDSEGKGRLVVRGMDDEKKTLVLLDGEKITHDELQAIPAEDIESVSVLKGKAAIDGYQDEELDGVILITTKNSTGKREPVHYQADSMIVSHAFKDSKTVTSEALTNRLNSSVGRVQINDSSSLQFNDKTVELKGEDTSGNRPLIIVGTEKMPKDFELNSLNPKEIESISVLKNESAIQFHGEEGKHGVIVITKKNAK